MRFDKVRRRSSKSMDWFLYDNGLRHERVKRICYLFNKKNKKKQTKKLEGGL